MAPTETRERREKDQCWTCTVGGRQGDVVEGRDVQEVVVDVDVEHGDLPVVRDPVVLVGQGVRSVTASDGRTAAPSPVVITLSRSAVSPSDVLNDSRRERKGNPGRRRRRRSESQMSGTTLTSDDKTR
jgi:hypothetical protein